MSKTHQLHRHFLKQRNNADGYLRFHRELGLGTLVQEIGGSHTNEVMASSSELTTVAGTSWG